MSNPFFSQGPLGQTRPDNLKVTKSALKFGPLSFTRVNTVPPMEYGRPGDVVLVDDTDSPSTIPQSNQTPSSVGMWIKVPLSYESAPAGNVVSGFPAATTNTGSLLSINGVTVALNAPNTVAQAVVDINAAGIPNVAAISIGEALIIQEITGGPLTFQNVVNRPINRLGLYDQKAISVIQPNGVWVPFAMGQSGGGGGGAPTGSSYLTLGSNPTLTNERVLTAGTGIDTVDGGSNSTLTINLDIDSIPAITEPVAPNDAIAIYNDSTGNVEKVPISSLPTSTPVTDAVRDRTVIIGLSGTTSVGLPVPANTVIRRVLLEITTPYSTGTTIQIGDAAQLDRLMEDNENDPSEISAYETTTVHEYAASTQILVTIGGSPATGAGRVIIDYIVL